MSQKPNEVPRFSGPVPPLIVFDWDGTYVDKSGQHLPVCAETLHRARAEGAQFAIASDTSLSGLRFLAEIAGINLNTIGTWLGENGAVMGTELDGLPRRRTYMVNHSEEAERHKQFRAALAEAAERLGWYFVSTHPSSAELRGKLLSGLVIGDRPRPLLAIDETREVSGTGVIRLVSPAQGELPRVVVDRATAEGVLWQVRHEADRFFNDGAKRIEADTEGHWWDFPAADVDKEPGLRDIQTTWRGPVYFICDGSNDVCGSRVEGLTLVAVGDARDKVKDVAHYVMPDDCPNSLGWNRAVTQIMGF